MKYDTKDGGSQWADSGDNYINFQEAEKRMRAYHYGEATVKFNGLLFASVSE
jgi:hypothetical protein